VQNVQYSAPSDPVQGSSSIASAMAAEAGLMAGDGDDDGIQAMAPGEEVVQTPVRVEKTPGRNEPCFCGSGKKYKKCCGT
jgi:hypothetical protein